MSQHLIIENKNIQFKLEGKALTIVYPDRKPASIPLRLLKQITLLANVELPAHLLHKLAQQGIGVSILNPRSPQPITTCSNHQHLDYQRREKQYALIHAIKTCNQASYSLVKAKLRSQNQLLLKLAKRRPEYSAKTLLAVKSIQAGLPSSEFNSSQLLGVEGSAARQYFQAYGRFFNPSWGFEGRNKRPPKDPVNSLLSLGYSLLLSEAEQALQRVGLDPAFGFYHKTAYGRSSLACDLMELYRTQIDFFVYELLAEQTLKPAHFGYQQAACLLTKEGRSRFFPAYHSAIKPTRRALQLTAHRWVALLMDAPNPSWLVKEVA
ncbi:MAG: CRISPR-associated endonuclease Cas1 [Pseudomonadaceae bacterium]|nr:CRISPR-associated endonuclease Cas1 [Pseudomonadaceae bacterium]